MSRKSPALANFRRIVVKVGSSLLVDSDGRRLHQDWLSSLAQDIATLHGDQRDMLVVSSGAIALGRAVLKLPTGPLKLEDSQAAAAVGQIALARTWSEVLGRHDITAGRGLVPPPGDPGGGGRLHMAPRHEESVPRGGGARG